MKNGNIPENLTFIARQPTEIEWRFDDLDDNARKATVKPAFASDATNTKTLQTGRDWAANWRWDSTTRAYVPQPTTETTLPNTPFKNLRIVNLEKRSEGGRAWKVITEDSFYFDLREDVLLDALTTTGCRKDGTLNGEFIWAKVGSQMKIIRVGSALHKAILQSQTRAAAKKIPNKDLQIGGLYQTKNGATAIFLGNIESTDYQLKQTVRYTPYQDTRIYTYKPIPKVGLWWDFYTFQNKDFEQLFNNDLADPKHQFYHLKIRKSSSFIQKVGQINLPSDFIYSVRERMVANRKAESWWDDLHAYSFEYNDFSTFANMVPAGEPQNDHPMYKDIKKLIDQNGGSYTEVVTKRQ
jgi:hypothetical protein